MEPLDPCSGAEEARGASARKAASRSEGKEDHDLGPEQHGGLMGEETKDLMKDVLRDAQAMRRQPDQAKTIIQAIGFSAGVITFCHLYLFPSKQELEATQREIAAVKTMVVMTQKDMKHARELEAHSRAVDAKVLDNLKANLEKFMSRKGVRPIKVEDPE